MKAFLFHVLHGTDGAAVMIMAPSCSYQFFEHTSMSIGLRASYISEDFSYFTFVEHFRAKMRVFFLHHSAEARQIVILPLWFHLHCHL